MLILFALSSGGCSSLKTFLGPGPEPPRAPEQSHKPPPRVTPVLPPKSIAEQLARARELLQGGKDDAARELFQKIGVEKSLPGVTDEALFHQGLLSLKYESEAAGYPQSRQIMERLIRDYPGSVWAIQATTLNSILIEHWQDEVALAKVRRQLKTLKESNVSLSRENKEMHLNIGKLKTLEQELELKSRR